MAKKQARLGDETDFSYRVKRVTKVIDGDTIDIILDMGFDIMYKQRVRLFGIDTPESRTRDKVEKKYGLLAKQFLKDTENYIFQRDIPPEFASGGRIPGHAPGGVSNLFRRR